MNGARVLITVISAATGACFALLAGLSIRAMAFPVRRFHNFSIVIAVGAGFLACLAFRLAMARDNDEEVLVTSLQRGIAGAFVGLFAVTLLLFMFGTETRSFVAHSLNRPTSSFTTFRLLIAWVLLGFGAGFVLRTRGSRNPVQNRRA